MEANLVEFAMKIFRYRLMHYPPSWGGNRELAEYDFHFEAVQAMVRQHLDYYGHFPAVLKFPARVRERDNLRALQERLTESADAPTPIAWPHGEDDGVWWFMDVLALEGRWEKARCLSCAALYGFAECRVENWSVGGGLAAEGGRDMFGACGHLLCHSREWNS